MKVALYGRVSKDEKFRDSRYQEVETQMELLREFAKTKGYEISGEYIDHWSGADPNRPAFKKMMSETDKFNAIIVWKLDRFSRETMLNTLVYIDKLKRKGINLISLTESWMDLSNDNPMTQLIIAILSWVAEEERNNISKRTKASIQRLKNIGAWTGGRPKNKRGGAKPLVDKK
jgi:site-specific DNA recombinase